MDEIELLGIQDGPSADLHSSPDSWTKTKLLGIQIRLSGVSHILFQTVWTKHNFNVLWYSCDANGVSKSILDKI